MYKFLIRALVVPIRAVRLRINYHNVKEITSFFFAFKSENCIDCERKKRVIEGSSLFYWAAFNIHNAKLLF